MNLDLSNSPEDGSLRMLNAIEPGSPLPIHRHTKSSETVVILRGHLREVFYNDAGEVTEVIDLVRAETASRSTSRSGSGTASRCWRAAR